MDKERGQILNRRELCLLRSIQSSVQVRWPLAHPRGSQGQPRGTRTNTLRQGGYLSKGRETHRRQLSIAANGDLLQFSPVIVSLQCTACSGDEYLTRKYVIRTTPHSKRININGTKIEPPFEPLEKTVKAVIIKEPSSPRTDLDLDRAQQEPPREAIKYSACLGWGLGAPDYLHFKTDLHRG